MAVYGGSCRPEAKISFLVGFDAGFNTGFTVDAQVTISRLEAGQKLARNFLPAALSYSDVVKGVDRFYEDPANLILPIVDAMEIFAFKANGATQVQIDAKLANFRERSIKAAEGEEKRP